MSEFVKVLLGDQGTFEDVYQECPVFDDGKYCLRLVAERMREAVSYWLWEYERRGFVRWGIFNHKEEEVIGTVELFHRDSEDYFKDCGLLRLDLRSDYEKADVIKEILQQIETLAFDMFSCRMLATKAVPTAKERIQALSVLGYEESDHALTGHDGTQYKYYWVLNKK